MRVDDACKFVDHKSQRAFSLFCSTNVLALSCLQFASDFLIFENFFSWSTEFVPTKKHFQLDISASA